MNNINKNKKGSHVGVVVSFVIFVTFLVFLYVILHPVTAREREKQYILDYLILNILGESEGNLTTMIINVEYPVHHNKDCLNLNQILLSEGEPLEEGKIPFEMWGHLSFTSNGTQYSYYIKNKNNLYVGVPPLFQGILTVVYSEDITPDPADDLSNCDPHAYPLGYIRTFSEIFETKIHELEEEYYDNYEGLKAFLGLPEDTNFNFYVYDSERNEPPIIECKIQEPPTTISVFVEETPIQYTDESGNKMFGFLIVEVW